MDYSIIRLSPADHPKCSTIWNMECQPLLAAQFYRELLSGVRSTYIYQSGADFLGEISLVFATDDPDYTIAGRRLYVSHLVVRKEARRKGIGRALVHFAIEQAAQMSYPELSIGVDLDNYPALKLYADAGFDRIISIGEDKQGRYIKLLKTL